MYEILSVMPNFAIAAIVSPPPASENALDCAIAWAIVRVPSANCSYSNTPTGPFQMIVPALFSLCAMANADCLPMSRIKSSAATNSVDFDSALAVAENSFAVTTSIGMGTEPPLASSIAMIFFASPIRSGSASDLPIFPPMARMKVLAMPPPTIN